MTMAGTTREGRVRRIMAVVAVLQGVSTLVGFVELLLVPQWFAPQLEGTFFAGRQQLAAVLLGVPVGGFQWAALWLQARGSRWFVLAHAAAGLVMTCWIGAECLVIDSFGWPHALWGGLGVTQLLLVCVLLGVLRAPSRGREFSSREGGPR